MKIQQAEIQANAEEWKKRGYHVPAYDRKQMRQDTLDSPVWVHFGAGNLFRAFHANAAQRLLEKGRMKAGIIVAEGFDYEIIEKLYRPYDDYSILATLKADGTVEKTLIGSVAKSCRLDPGAKEDFACLNRVFQADSLQMATFTITEKGYSLTNAAGQLLPDVAQDMANGPKAPVSYMGKVTALLYARYCSGKKPIAMVSTDNCSHNGEKLFEAVWAFAEQWARSGRADAAFCDYIRDPDAVSFPWTMIDKITPRPDDAIQKMLIQDEVEAAAPIITAKHTYAAPFVNAEECEYLVVEDRFPNGRPPLEEAGLLFTDRRTVDRVERMKVCTCLNPLHTALAVFGCLLGYQKISDEMQDPALRRLVERLGYEEGLAVVTDPGILSPKEFLDTVLQVRIPNPFMPDTPQRIATDTSQKLPIRFGETIKAYAADENRDVQSLKMIPLVYAGWLRYLIGVDDEGRLFERSPDPMLESVQPFIEKLHIGTSGQVREAVRPLLMEKTIFGVDLFEVGLADRTCRYLEEMMQGKGAVKNTLVRYVLEHSEIS